MAVGIVVEMERVERQVKGVLHGLAKGNGVVERFGKGNAGVVGDLAAHADHEIDVLGNGLGLGQGKASIEHDQPNIAAQEAKHLAQGLGADGPGQAGIILEQDALVGGAMPGKMHDIGPMLLQRLLQITALHGRKGVQAYLMAMGSEAYLLSDLTHLFATGQALGIPGIGGEKEDLDGHALPMGRHRRYRGQALPNAIEQSAEWPIGQFGRADSTVARPIQDPSPARSSEFVQNNGQTSRIRAAVTSTRAACSEPTMRCH